MAYIYTFLMSLAITLAAVPLLVKIAEKKDFVDKPTERKKHKKAVPLVGGLAMFLGFSITFMTAMVLSDYLSFANNQMIAILVGGLLILSIGFIDDVYKTKGLEFAILPRVFIQLIAASIIFFADIRFTGFMNPINDTFFLFPIWAQYILTVTWIFGLTTVINFTDGLDGLAGSLCSISATTLFIVALYMGQPDSALMTIALLGACVGFLRYNLFPAKIFMGDSGANFLGYMLAVIALYGTFKQATVISVFIPVLAMGVPIFDNIFVIFKRMKERKPIYQADSSQIHYRLLNKGLNPVQVVTFLLLLSVCLNLTSIIILILH